MASRISAPAADYPAKPVRAGYRWSERLRLPGRRPAEISHIIEGRNFLHGHDSNLRLRSMLNATTSLAPMVYHLKERCW
jgi:hypothetical protein